MSVAQLYSYSANAVALAVALIVVALFGLNTETLIAAGMLWLVARGIFDYWLGGELPPPLVTFLYITALFGLIGGIQFIVLSATIATMFLFITKDVKKLGNSVSLLAGLRMAVPAGLIWLGGFLIIPFYEAFKIARRSLPMALALLALILMASYYFFASIAKLNAEATQLNPLHGIFGPLDVANPLVWFGVIAYEELVGRPTPAANAFFVLLHTPSRLWLFRWLGPIGAALVTIFILLILHYVTRWLWSLYKNHGLIASVVGHAVYNATVSSFFFSVAGLFLFLVGLAAYILIRDESDKWI